MNSKDIHTYIGIYTHTYIYICIYTHIYIAFTTFLHVGGAGGDLGLSQVDARDLVKGWPILWVHLDISWGFNGGIVGDTKRENQLYIWFNPRSG